MEEKKIRILIAKIGLDGHDRGAKVVARGLRDAGMEVIYTGIRQSVQGTVTAAIQEDVDVIGLSFLAGDHMVILPNFIKELKQQGREDIPVIVGGIILPQQVETILNWGVHKIMLPGTPIDEIVDFIKNRLNDPKTAKL